MLVNMGCMKTYEAGLRVGERVGATVGSISPLYEVQEL
jgi:hypothetical protein